MVAASGLVVGLALAGVVVALLAANYIAVTIQERRAGSRPGTARGKPSTADTSSVDWDAAADPRFREQLAAGRTIEAIKTYRGLTGLGLKEAKDVVDFLREHPGLLDPPASRPLDPPARRPVDPPARRPLDPPAAPPSA